MKLLASNSRGMALVMAMIVVVLMTILVAGAISFTGTESGAAALQAREDQMSSCVQAARNLFLSRMRILPAVSVETVDLNDVLSRNELGEPEMTVAGRHFTGTPTIPPPPGVKFTSIADATDTVQDRNVNVDGLDQQAGNPQKTKFYAITAVCKEFNHPSAPEREVEFLVRVGL